MEIYNENRLEEYIDYDCYRAKEYQGGDTYSGIDNYEEITFPKGFMLAKLAGTTSDYFTTLEATKESDYNSTLLSEGVQVAPYYNKETGKYNSTSEIEAFIV